MPANLTPEYLEAERHFREAQTPDQKLEGLRHMLSVIPKHKGTEKMRADIKRRISKLQDAARQARKTGRRAQIDHVEREGAGQVVLVGAPNSGKSSLLVAVTNAKADVAPYAFATQRPLPGMMNCEDIQIQLVDLPPLAEGMTPSWALNVIRNADGAVLLANLAQAGLIAEMETLLSELRNGRVEPVREDGPDERVGWVRKPSLVAAAQMDREGARSRVRDLRAWVGDRFPIVTLSAASGEGLDDLRSAAFDLLRLVRIYSKMPSKPPDLAKPFVLKRGDTVLDVARLIHRDFAVHLKYAKIWGQDKYDGQRVHKDHAVHDGDILELHMK